MSTKVIPYISAGHHLKDPGAVATHVIDGAPVTFKESELAIRVKIGVYNALRKIYGGKIVTDDDKETLAQYLGRIKTGSGSVICEFHFDAAANNKATGTTALIGNDATANDRAFAMELSQAVAKTLGIGNRGVWTEGQSHRGRLGIMRKDGIVCLMEICFISNLNDLQSFFKNEEALYTELARIIKKYDDLIP